MGSSGSDGGRVREVSRYGGIFIYFMAAKTLMEWIALYMAGLPHRVTAFLSAQLTNHWLGQVPLPGSPRAAGVVKSALTVLRLFCKCTIPCRFRKLRSEECWCIGDARTALLRNPLQPQP